LAGRILRNGAKLHDGEELKGLEWSAGSARAAQWLDEPGPWVCENVAMARALRKWLIKNPVGVPADLIIHLRHPVCDSVPGQEAMAAGCHTVWEQIEPELIRRGAKILQARVPGA